MEVLTFPFSPCNTSDGYNFSFSGQKSPKHLLHKTASKLNCLRFILQFYKIHIFRVSDIGAIASSQACCSFTETTLSCGPDLAHFTQLFTRVTGGSALAKEFLITLLEFIGGSLIPMCKRCRLNFLLPRVCEESRIKQSTKHTVYRSRLVGQGRGRNLSIQWPAPGAGKVWS